MSSGKKRSRKSSRDNEETPTQLTVVDEETRSTKKRAKVDKEDKDQGTNETQQNKSEVQAVQQLPLPDLPLTASTEDNLFSLLQIDETLKQAIKDMGFEKMMTVQQQSIPQALLGRDILGSAKTGSGKTLAFLIPAIQLLIETKFKPRNGTGVIIITPTRELALQIYGVASELFKYNTQKTFAIVTGGMPREPEEDKLRRGTNLLVATPGRLLDHLQHTKGFQYSNLKCLVVDEADRILEEGFEEELRSIIRLLPQQRQTMMFSATQTRNVKDLAKLSLNSKPHEVHVDLHQDVATAEGLEQGYVVCDSDTRFLLLFTFLKKNLKRKMIVFFSSCLAVKYYADLLNYIDVSVLSLHGKQKQTKRSKTFFEFVNAERGILLSTDVAARGLDIPRVDWIIQYDPPDDPKEYIHRVGRTARGLGGKGRALLFLLPSELQFLKYLKELKVPLEEYEFPKNKVANIQPQVKFFLPIFFLRSLLLVSLTKKNHGSDHVIPFRKEVGVKGIVEKVLYRNFFFLFVPKCSFS
eukprot:TRINITY_DN374_c0_g1_i2.p1 TRINITY_DN374_c0_g1~~TRINITY_DN374_c0_g1_i2.p1  ORF type:complete len:524 (-),score=109.98 TRINITY_DN374_c0_g1_i2:432-2003(-)